MERYDSKKSNISINYIVLIGIVVFLVYRAIYVINNYGTRGALPYVQLLNFSMPIVESQAYDETVYHENKLTLEKVLLETLGLNRVSTSGIITSELTLFKGFKVYNDNSSISTFNPLKPFELGEESISKNEEGDEIIAENTSQAYDPTLKSALEGKNLKVLIYHTHTHEGYSEIGAEKRWNTDNTDINVVGVGDVLTEELEENYGITVIHDKTIHDNDYPVCYDKSGETLQRYLSEYGDFDLIIDLHRDDPPRNKVLANINGEKLARTIFVTSAESSRVDANLALANELASISNTLFPGLMRDGDIMHYPVGGINGFNLSFSDNSVVWEVGSIENSSKEAKSTAKYIARIIAEYFNEK